MNYAHRGASAYAPENTMRAFRLAVELGANGIETDIRRTKDGVPVLFHDAALLRLTGIDKPVSDLTYKELSALRIPAPDGGAGDAVPTLTDFLAFAAANTFFCALELKEDGLEADAINAVDAFGLADRCVFTSFEPARLRRIRTADPSKNVGLLVREVTDGILSELRDLGAVQICPHAALLSPETTARLHSADLNVRVWGVRDEATMAYALRCGVDGMTVNFPDKLRALLTATKGLDEFHG